MSKAMDKTLANLAAKRKRRPATGRVAKTASKPACLGCGLRRPGAK